MPAAMTLLELNLRAAGASQLLLALLHLSFSRRFNWAGELARLSLLNRQIFYVHTFFVALVVAGMGVLSLVGTAALLATGPLVGWVAGGCALFWLCRLYCQFFYYDADLWRGNRFNTTVHVLFAALWSWYSLTYAWLFAHSQLLF